MISVEKDRLEDGPFCVWQIDVSSDDSEAPLWYTAHKSSRAFGRGDLDPGGREMALRTWGCRKEGEQCPMASGY
jgi:hypothetical protein